MSEEKKDFRVVPGAWELSGFNFRVEGRGMRLMMQGMKEGKFTGIRCGQCGTVYLPGPFYCRKCLVEIDEPVDITDRGTIKSFTATMSDIRGNPLEEPQIALMVQLDGCDSWIMGVLRDADWREVKIGQRVKVKWKPAEERNGSLQDMDCFEYE
jgi:uncharacterized OB-fold protein